MLPSPSNPYIASVVWLMWHFLVIHSDVILCSSKAIVYHYLLSPVCISAHASLHICSNSVYLLMPICLSAYACQLIYITCHTTHTHVCTVVICEASLLSFIMLICLRQSASWTWTTSSACYPCRYCSLPPSSLFIFVQVQRWPMQLTRLVFIVQVERSPCSSPCLQLRRK
jgi:hypothetical protein